MKMSKSRGFGVAEVIVVLVVIVLIVLGGWYVWNAQNNSSHTQEPTTANTGAQKEWKSYSDPVGEYTIKYPTDWKLKTDSTPQGSNPDYPTSSVILTSPKGTEVVFNSNFGGRGGACEPNPTDKPFQPGNRCPSAELVSVEKLTTQGFYKRNYEGGKLNTVPQSINLVAQRYSWDAQKFTYTFGLLPQDLTASLKEPQMGFILTIFPLEISHQDGSHNITIETHASSDDAAFLENTEGQTAREIFRSFSRTQ